LPRVYFPPSAGVSGLSACPLSKLQISDKAYSWCISILERLCFTILTFATSSTAGTPFSCSKSTPLVRCHRVQAKLPLPASYNCAAAGGFSEHNAATSGATNSGLMACTCSSAHTVRVIFVPADGAIALATMLYLAPSRAQTLVKPMMPDFWTRLARL
jgi:hypothetical protein